MLEPCAGSHIERSRVRPIGRRRRSVQAPAHTTRHDRSSRARGNAPRSGSAGQSSRDSLAPIIPQTVTARTEAARRSGTRRARGFGGRGAPAWACKVTRTSGFAWYLRGGGRGLWWPFCACGRHCSVISGWGSGLVVDEASICLTCVDHPTSRQSITELVVIGAECWSYPHFPTFT
jgi:hypothetical protein